MSSTIVYHQLAVRFPRAFIGLGEDLYAILAQAGSSNCYDHTGRRSRSWQAIALGTASAVMRQSIDTAGSCEGGMLKVRHARGDVKPEQFITTARNLLKRAADITLGPVRFKEGYVTTWFTVPDDASGAPGAARKVYLTEQPSVHAWLASPEFARHLDTAHPYQLVGVSGPEIR